LAPQDVKWGTVSRGGTGRGKARKEGEDGQLGIRTNGKRLWEADGLSGVGGEKWRSFAPLVEPFCGGVVFCGGVFGVF